MFWTFWTAYRISYLIDLEYYLFLNEDSRSPNTIYPKGDIL